MRINAALFDFIPKGVGRSLMALAPVRQLSAAVMKDLGLPAAILDFINYPTRFDCRETEKALAGSGIAVPPLETYAWRLWDYWERHLDPDLFVDRTLMGRFKGDLASMADESSGIGRTTAFRLAEAGAVTLAGQLGATLDVGSGPGATFALTFDTGETSGVPLPERA